MYEGLLAYVHIRFHLNSSPLNWFWRRVARSPIKSIDSDAIISILAIPYPIG
jgi:hypothetical protein